MVDGTELVEIVLDALSCGGFIETWSRHAKLAPGPVGSRHIIDVYELTYTSDADCGDREGLEAFLQRYGRTGHGHEVKIRILRQDGPGKLHS